MCVCDNDIINRRQNDTQTDRLTVTDERGPLSKLLIDVVTNNSFIEEEEIKLPIIRVEVLRSRFTTIRLQICYCVST